MAVEALRGRRSGYFGATYKLLGEVYDDLLVRLSPAVTYANKTERRIRLATGGLIEFWTLEDRDAGRSRAYHLACIDEAGLVPDLESIWHNAIRPTLADYAGRAWFAGTPKGRNYFWTAFLLGRTEPDWISWQVPASANPHIPAEEIAAARRGMPDRSFRQEFLAEFLEESGGVFSGVREAVGWSGDPVPPYSVGVDLARAEDYTVVSVLDAEGRQVYLDRWHQAAWEVTIARIADAARRYPGTLTVDSTGLGDPIYERLRNLNLNARGYQITSASKPPLIDNLCLLIEQQRVRLLHDAVQLNELMAYQYEYTGRTVRTAAPPGMHDDTVIALALAAWPLRCRPVYDPYDF